MGLDAYLRKLNVSPAEYDRLYAEHIPIAERLAEETEGEEDYDKCKAKYLAAGLCEYGGFDADRYSEKIELPSAKWPNHMFKIGYVRSSYNDGGYNQVVQNHAGLDGVYFSLLGGREAEEVSGLMVIDWQAALARAVELRDKFESAIKEHGAFQAWRVMGHKQVRSGEEAMTVFRAQRAKWSPNQPFADSPYGCYDGEFFPKGAKVLGVIQGGSRYGANECYLIVEAEPHAEFGNEPLGWYRRANEIVVEMCEWVLAQEHPDRFRMVWSA